MIKLESISATPREVRTFGLMFAGLGVLLAGYNIYKQGNAWPVILVCAGLFLAGGVFGYSLLRPVYIIWMKFASLLAWVNTRIILGLAYYLILTPIGVVMRIFGKDTLGLTTKPTGNSYWVRREKPYDPQQTEKQF